MSLALEVRGVESGYGKIQVLWGVDVTLKEGSMVAVLGPNGAGKTTLLRTIMGIIRAWRGSVMMYGLDITSMPSHRRVELGLTMVPEGRRLFPDLTVRENLELGAYTRRARERIGETLELVFNLFPRLKERLHQKAGSLSGGEQQMLAIARALMTRPKVLMLDEPSQGLAPKIAWEVAEALDKIRREVDISVILVEQNVALALEKADYVYLLEQGRVVLEGFREEVLARKLDIVRSYLGY
ncbi:MAG: ABC transporter ATP-binding protein [Desulfurococcaceae archaeon]|nr:ABC transporter ATP-binding protein [Desulfurococcaceae archaeon]MCC6059944.1 ABC transporter ATP-binding protein [Desulfurococcaceae archaeon]